MFRDYESDDLLLVALAYDEEHRLMLDRALRYRKRVGAAAPQAQEEFPPNGYIVEDASQFYITENGNAFYVTEA